MTALPIVKVRVESIRKKGKKFASATTGALLDTGSERSFISRWQSDYLQLEGETIYIRVGTILGRVDEKQAQKVNTKVSSVGLKTNCSIEMLRVIVVETLP